MREPIDAFPRWRNWSERRGSIAIWRLPGCWEIAHRDDTAGEALPWKDDGHGVRIVRTVAGGTVDPMALLTQLAVAAAGAGAVLHEHAEVRRLIIEPHPVEPHPVLELEGAVIRPRFVIVAVNAWTSHLLPAFARWKARSPSLARPSR